MSATDGADRARRIAHGGRMTAVERRWVDPVSGRDETIDWVRSLSALGFGMADGPWRHGFLAVLGPRERMLLDGIATERTVLRGRTVFDQARTASTLAVVLEGRVKVTFTTPAGDERLLALRGPGELLGEVSALVDRPRTATVVALDLVRLAVLPADAFQELCRTEPAFGHAVIRTLAERLSETDQYRVDAASEANVRLARVLVRLARQYGEPGSGTEVFIDLALTQEDLASLVSASRGAVARGLRELREDGLVRTARRRLVVADVDELERRFESL
jgi:CRP/FNR family transcriptional regulator, cyclic AMP receptor protein